MTLTTRVSFFFLSMLAVVLIGFSVGIYLLARVYLLRQVDSRLESSLSTLAAVAETTDEGVEWDPHQRTLFLDDEEQNGPLCWMIVNEQGAIIDSSSAADAAQLQQLCSAPNPAKAADVESIVWNGRAWQTRSRRLVAPSGAATADKHKSKNGSADPTEQTHRHLDIRVAASLQPAQSTLGAVGWVVSGLSLASWILAFVVGRRLCGRALAPVREMAAAARGMKVSRGEERLPVSAAKDELAALALAFNSLLDRLHESLERQSRFTAEASHQLRTPLTAMLGHIEVILRQERPREEYVQVLGLVHAQAQEMRQMIDSLLFLSRADEESPIPQLEKIPLAPWLRERLPAGKTLPRGNDIRLELENEASTVRAHPVLLAQLLDNLIDNACKYSEPGTPITVRVSSPSDSVLISIVDEGMGLCDEDLPRVFQPFFRGAAARAKGIRGTGLGLAIAARLAKAFGGTLEMAHSPPRGTCVTLRLPEANGLA